MVDPVTATKAAGGFFKVLQNEPLSLALCVMNFSLIGFVYFQSSQFNTQRADNVKLFTDVQREVQKLLSECIVPPRQQRGQLPSDPNAPTSISHPEGR
jgi:membrane-anchored glycerophosphoryl diester phosphodiesterase (GDPDase)